MKKSTSDFLGIVLVTAVVGLILTLITGNSFLHGSPKNQVKSANQEAVTTVPPKNSTFEVAGWIPDWASESGLESVKKNSSQLTNISPVWYEAQPDGTLKVKKPAQSEQIIKEAKNNGIRITPSIALFDHEILTSIFTDPAKLQTHINQIVAAGSEENIDGIDIDYESTKLSDKEGFFKLLEGVYKGLSAKNKVTIITVVPQWGNDIRYLSLIETRQVQDWTRISNFADEIRIMAYDYTWQGAAFPGPIAPLDWQEQIIKYALTKVPAEKLVLGIHLYSYEKYIEKQDPGVYRADLLPFMTNWEANLGERNDSRAYTYSTIQKIYRENTIIQEDQYQGEKIIRYSKFNEDSGKFEDRITVFIDPKGVADRVDLARKYNLKGVAFWRLGGEEDLLSEIKAE